MIRLVHKSEQSEGDPVRLLEMRHLREDAQNMTTIMPVHEHIAPPEPERVARSVEDDMSKQTRATQCEQWGNQRGTIAKAIAVLREAGLRDRELWFMERRMARLDAKYPPSAA